VEQSWRHFGNRAVRGWQTGPPNSARHSVADTDREKVSFAEAGYAEGGSGGTPVEGPAREPLSKESRNSFACLSRPPPDGGDLDMTIAPQYGTTPSAIKEQTYEDTPKTVATEAEAFSLLAPATVAVTNSASVGTLPATPTPPVKKNGFSPRTPVSNGQLRRSESACTGLALGEVGSKQSNLPYRTGGGSGSWVQVKAPGVTEMRRRSSQADIAPSVSPSRPVAPLTPTTPSQFTTSQNARQASPPPPPGQQGYTQGRSAPSAQSGRGSIQRTSSGTAAGQQKMTVARANSMSQLVRGPPPAEPRSSTPRQALAQTPGRSTTPVPVAVETRGATRSSMPMQVAAGLPVQRVSRDSTPRRSQWPPQPCWPGGQATPGRPGALAKHSAMPGPASRQVAGATSNHHRSPSPPVFMGMPGHFRG